MVIDPAALERFAAAPVARLATADRDARPHLVPITFAVDDTGAVVTAVDRKPKRTRQLKRLRNIAANRHVSVLVDHYQDDWAGLWWVRADGSAHVVDDPAGKAAALEALLRKYPQYRTDPPDGPVIRIAVHRWASWAA